KVDAIILERSKMLDQLVTDNLELLVKLQGAREGGDKTAAATLRKELSEKATPLIQRGPIATEIAGVLSKEQGTEPRGLRQEYWQAIVAEDTAKPASQREADDDQAMLTDPHAPAHTPPSNPIRDRKAAMRDEVLAMT